MDAKSAGDRERENYGFYPSQSLIQSGWNDCYIGPANPFNQGR
jgi:hypothetical protein